LDEFFGRKTYGKITFWIHMEEVIRVFITSLMKNIFVICWFREEGIFYCISFWCNLIELYRKEPIKITRNLEVPMD